MAWALDRVAVQLALAEHAAVVGADVVDGAPLAVLGQARRQRAAVDLDDAHGAGVDVGRAAGREAAARALDGHAALSSVEPMRAASASRIARLDRLESICGHHLLEEAAHDDALSLLGRGHAICA